MSDPAHAPSADLWRLLARAIESPTREHASVFAALSLTAPGGLDDWRAAHTGAFVTQCAPYASVYVGAAGRIGGEAAARVADFRRLLGAERVDATADHLPDLLADYAELVALATRDARAAHARHAMFWEHLAAWLTPFAGALARSAPAPYAGWARLLHDVLRAEAGALPAPARSPLHLRAAPAWTAPAEDADRADVARAWLVPAATGMVLTPADLITAGRALGVALPAVARPFLLKTLLEQDPRATDDWLAGEAARQSAAHAQDCDVLGPVAAFWAGRARATADRLAAGAGARAAV